MLVTTNKFMEYIPLERRNLRRTPRKNIHKSVKIPLRIVRVDKDALPIVRWLNKMNDTFTLYSCAGDTYPNAPRPYVSFVCRHGLILRFIKRAVEKHAEEFITNYEVDVDDAPLFSVHVICFRDSKRMEAFCRLLKRGCFKTVR